MPYLVGDLIKEITAGGPIPSFPKSFKEPPKLEKEKDALAQDEKKLQAALDDVLGLVAYEHLREWDTLFIMSFNTARSESFDQVYALMGLVQERQQFQPGYNISEKELLWRLLRSELAARLEAPSISYPELMRLVCRWLEEQCFEPIRPSEWTSEDSMGNTYEASEEETKQYVRLIVQAISLFLESGPLKGRHSYYRSVCTLEAYHQKPHFESL